MTQQVINIGSAVNDGTGDPLRTAFGFANDNFTELYNITDNLVIGTDVQAHDADLDTFVVTGEANYFLLDGSRTITGETVISTSKTAAANGDSSIAIDGNATMALNGKNFVSAWGLSFKSETTGSGGAFCGNVGMLFDVVNNSSTDLLTFNGVDIAVSTQLGSTGGCSGIASALTISKSLGGTGAFVGLAGAIISNLGDPLVTDAFGLKIEKQSGSATNTGIWMNGDDKGSDIMFGTGKDIRQHFNNTLLEFEGSGISYTADASGTHTGYVEIAINGTAYKFLVRT